MKSLEIQLADAIAAERAAAGICDELSDQVWAAKQVVARLELRQRTAHAEMLRCQQERQAIERALGRERLYQNRRLR